MTDLHALDLHTLTRLIERRDLRALELTDALIARADRVPHVFATPTFDLARRMAAAADAEIAAGNWRGPLHGIPVGLKDALDAAGVPTTVCSRLYPPRLPDRDAVAWGRLRRAGAVLMGKLHCAELCLGAPGADDAWPWPAHPLDAARTPGGSSSGAGVALARGLLPAALGTDTAGSIRIPAAFCGVAGLKPTDGLVSREGAFPLAPTLDQVGPMARTSRDCAMLLDVLAPGAGHAAALTERLDGLRLGHVPAFADAVSAAPGHRAALERALGILRALGAEVREVTLPPLREFTDCALTLMLAEAWGLHGAALRAGGDRVSRITRLRIGAGAACSPEDRQRALADRARLAQRTAEAMAGLDALVYPAMAADPARTMAIGPLDYMRAPMLTAPANVAGAPAASVRCGLSANGLPMAFQVAGRPGGDGMVLRIAHAFEAATPELAIPLC
jgi:aspartyl-tRNA(Asn)/glutamyl-tRNA(Gln) amidotransferase subunit A